MRRSESVLRAAGIAAAIASAVVAVVALTVALLPPAVDPSQYSAPSTVPVFAAYQVVYAVHHLVLAWALLAIRWSGAAGSGRLGAVGAVGSAAAMIALAGVEAWAATAGAERIDSELSLLLNAVYGVITLPLGVLLILLGAAVVRAKVWTGYARWVVLIAGIWVFVPLTPALAIDFTFARFALIGWMIWFIAAGIALARRPAASVADAPATS